MLFAACFKFRQAPKNSFLSLICLPKIINLYFFVFYCIFTFLSTVAPSVLKDCFSGGRGKQLKNNNKKEKDKIFCLKDKSGVGIIVDKMKDYVVVIGV